MRGLPAPTSAHVGEPHARPRGNGSRYGQDVGARTSPLPVARRRAGTPQPAVCTRSCGRSASGTSSPAAPRIASHRPADVQGGNRRRIADRSPSFSRCPREAPLACDPEAVGSGGVAAPGPAAEEWRKARSAFRASRGATLPRSGPFTCGTSGEGHGGRPRVGGRTPRFALPTGRAGELAAAPDPLDHAARIGPVGGGSATGPARRPHRLARRAFPPLKGARRPGGCMGPGPRPSMFPGPRCPSALAAADAPPRCVGSTRPSSFGRLAFRVAARSRSIAPAVREASR